ncbi:MAG: response regulator transcription factor [Chloroflexi bacterium]|nr:response regulator transcription factor [Chloroflexota bacterium]MBP8056780.1 response regulator transcription factor [Chloroflexota bacterium]
MTTPTKPIRVVLIDDHRQLHEIVAAILRTVPDINLVGQGANGNDALNLCQELAPDVVLMDVLMPVMNGIEATRLIHERFPQIKVLVLSSYQDHESVYSMLRNGAVGYLIKGALSQDLVYTIRTTYQGQAVFSPEVASRLINPPPTDTLQRFHLTDRELEVLVLMAEGLTVAQIAQKLFISQSTVKFHTTNILSKLGVQTRSEALIFAAKNNLV